MHIILSGKNPHVKRLKTVWICRASMGWFYILVKAVGVFKGKHGTLVRGKGRGVDDHQ